MTRLNTLRKLLFFLLFAIIALPQPSLASDTPCAEEIVPTVVEDYTYPADWFAPHLIMEISNIVGGPHDYMTDAAGDIVWGGVWRKLFGHVAVNPPSAVENNLRFQGQYYDAETGLHYNWHRYYDPETGRYLTPDPIGLAGGINPYVYVQNDPVNMIDPTGELASVIGGAIGGGIVGGFAGGFVGGVSSYISGDSMSGVMNSATGLRT